MNIFTSIVIHKTKQNYNSSIEDAKPEIFWKFYYGERNRIFLLKKKFKFPLKYFYIYIKTFFIRCKACFSNKNGCLKLVKFVAMGIIAGFFFYPRIEYFNQNN
jgi:hypothetical protein